MTSPAASLRRLETLRAEFSEGSAARKLALLRALERARLPSAAAVLKLHESLCFLRAYPDDAAVLAEVDEMLAAFERRPNLKAHRDALADSGIAGAEIHFTFFQPTASWLSRRHPQKLAIRWDDFERGELLDRWLPLLTLYTETPGLDEIGYSPSEWIEILKGPRESDADFVIRRFDALAVDSFAREKMYDELAIPLTLSPAPGTPSRTLARFSGSTPFFQGAPLSRARPAIPAAVLTPPLAVRDASEAEARELIDLARGAMVTRSRDLDVFAWADERDVRIIDCGQGLEFACLGARPERRLLLESVYGFLTLHSGVPIGYVLSSALFSSSEIAYNVFDTWRGAEAAAIYGHVLSAVHHLFGSTAFTVYPYQLGHDNEEGIESGAWWFYYKLGFRPRDPRTVKIMNRELAAMKRDPSHRSSPAVLRELAASNVYLHLDPNEDRADVIGLLSLPQVGLRASRYLARRFGADREGGRVNSAREAAELLGAGPTQEWTDGERQAWDRWAPVALVLPGVGKWSPEDRRAFAEVIRAKGSRRESEFVRRFDSHKPLRRALWSIARD